MTPLHLAAVRGEVEIVRLLLDHGVSPEARDCIGNTPLMTTAFSGDQRSSDMLEIMSLLLEYGSDIDTKSDSGSTAVHSAIAASNVSGLKMLISHGADVNACGYSGETPLHDCARGLRNRESPAGKIMLSLLLEAGADPKLKNRDGMSPLDLAIYWDDSSLISILEKYVKSDRTLP